MVGNRVLSAPRFPVLMWLILVHTYRVRRQPSSGHGVKMPAPDHNSPEQTKLDEADPDASIYSQHETVVVVLNSAIKPEWSGTHREHCIRVSKLVDRFQKDRCLIGDIHTSVKMVLLNQNPIYSGEHANHKRALTWRETMDTRN